MLVLTHARALGFRGELLKDIGLGALLHDIGKLSLPGELLRKPERLTAAEWAEVRRHPELGCAHICELDPTTTVPALVAYEHHLRYDGEPNYPRLRSRRQPILASALTSVADTFDAVQTVRPYAQSGTREEAFRALRTRAGTYLDPLLVASFCALFGAKKGAVARTAPPS
jgi:response regulator RpfG family c-di-GMP phosphodiesterase